jgi:hypothetical protein
MRSTLVKVVEASARHVRKKATGQEGGSRKEGSGDQQQAEQGQVAAKM